MADINNSLGQPQNNFNLRVNELGEPLIENVYNIEFEGAVVTDEGDNKVKVTIEQENLNLRVYEEGQPENSNIDEIAFIGATVTESGGKVTVTITGGGSQDLQDTLDNGKTATFIDPQGTQIDVSIGEYSEDNFNSPITFTHSRTFEDIEQISRIYQALGGVQFSTYIYNLLTNIGKTGSVFSDNGDIGLFTQNQFSTFSKDQSFGFEDETVEPSENLEIFYKPNPKNVSGTYYLATLDDIVGGSQNLQETLDNGPTAILSGGNTLDLTSNVELIGDEAYVGVVSSDNQISAYLAIEDLGDGIEPYIVFTNNNNSAILKLRISDLTAERNVQFPDKDGTIAMLDDIPIGDFIPLSGTTSGNPVIGDVRFLGDTFDFTTAKIYVRRDFNAESGVASESSIIFGGDTDKSGIILKTENLDNGDVSEIRLLEGNIEIISITNPIFVNGISFDPINGIIGGNDYSSADPSNLLIFAQRQYVQNGLALKANAPLIDTVSSSALTGVMTEGILKSYLIPANTYTASDILNFANDLYKTGTAGTVTSRLYTNTTASLSGASLLATNISTSGNRKITLRRQLVLKGGNIEVLLATSSTPDDNVNSSSPATIVTFNPAVDNYFITTAQNTSTGDSTIQNNFKLHY